MTSPSEAARAFLARLDAGLGLSVTALYASDSRLRAAVAELIAAERAAVREAYRELLFRAEEDAPTRDAAVALGRFAEAVLKLPLD